MKTRLRILSCIMGIALLFPALAFSQPAITLSGATVNDGVTIQNSDKIILEFTRVMGDGDTVIGMSLPAGLSTFTVTKDGSTICPIDATGDCDGSIVLVTASNPGSILVIGAAETPGPTATFVVTAEANGSVPLTSCDWIIDPPVNAVLQSVRAIPDIQISYPAEVYSGKEDIPLNAGATAPLFEPGTLTPTPVLASYSWTQTTGPAVTINGASTLNASFDAPTVETDTDLVFQLQVSDDADSTPGSGDELTGTVTVTVNVLAKEAPVDVVLCMDTSGSMGWHRTGSTSDLEGGCCSRLASAKVAAKYFVDRLGKFASDSRLGVAIFPAEPAPTPNYGARYAPGSDLAESGDFDSIKTAIGGESEMCGDCLSIPAVPGFPTGIPVNWNSTPTQYGLDAARTMLTTASGSDGRSRVILLLSDGAWNLGSDPADSTYLSGFVADGIKIYTLGMGTGVDNVNHTSLQNISVSTNIGAGGDPFGFTTYNFGEPASEPNLIPFLEKMMGHMVSLDFSVDPPDSIQPGQVKEYSALITDHDSLASFTVSWESSEKDILYMRVIAPDGTRLDPTEWGNGYQNVTVDKKYLEKNPGTWLIQVKNPSKNSTIVYNYSAMVKSTLNMDILLNKEKYNTNDSMVIEARLIDDNVRLKGAKVYATIKRPDMGVGNWQYEHYVSPDLIHEVPDIISREPMKRVEKKNIVLLEWKQEKTPEIIEDPKIILNDEGVDGDKYPNDGIYSGTYKNFIVPGIYKFQIFADGLTIKGQEFHREREVQKYVDMAVDPGITEKKGDIRIINRRPIMTISVTPFDKLENFLGPGYENQITITSSARPLIIEKEGTGVVDPDLNGKYQRQFLLRDPAEDPRVTIYVRGILIFDDLYSKLKNGRDIFELR